MYTLYSFLLRAVMKASKVYLNPKAVYPVDGKGTDDTKLREDLSLLFEEKLLCSKTFDETKMLESKEGLEIIPQMKRMMRNITTLMDCLTCEKCRVWGKVQTMGLRTAFRVIMTPDSEPLQLDRAEMVTLMNFLRQVALSISNVKTQCADTGSSAAPNPDL